MFYVKEPYSLGVPWVLSHHEDEKVTAIPENTTKELKNYHILGIEFLYQNYKKKFKGAILNEEDGLNPQLQVAAFLNAMLNSTEKKFLALIVTPDETLVNWHYHLKLHGGLKVQIVTPSICPEDFDQEHGLALILPFSNIKLAAHLEDYDYFSVIIDRMDEVANKLIVKRLVGSFNIGLSSRSFYTNPDQKLQWTMLNWSNPGCVGKLADFYEVDNDNFTNFRDNYRPWWFRLTWNFCESFQKPSFEEKQEYSKTLQNWSISNHINKCVAPKTEIKSRKRKEINTEETAADLDLKDNEEQKSKTLKTSQPVRRIFNKSNSNQDKIIYKNQKNNDELVDIGKISEIKEEDNNQCSSQETVIYEHPEIDEEQRDPKYVKLPSMDENPILNSIVRNLEKSPLPILTDNSPFKFALQKYDLDQPNCSKAFEEEDVLMSIINNSSATGSVPMDHATQISNKREELYSQLFDEEPCTSTSLQNTEDDFFQSLIEPEVTIKNKKESKSKKNDIDRILKETDMLLNE